MITSFTMNREAAEKVAGFNGIDKSGKYVGTLTQVEVAESKGGATYVEFAFKALRWTECGETEEERGEKMAFIRLFVSSRTGDRTFGADIMDALLAVLKLQNVEATPCKVYNRDNTTRQGYRIKDLEKQTVGLLLQRENREYESEGQIKHTYQMNIITPFNAVTGQNAKETLNNIEAKMVESKFKGLKDKEAKPVQSTNGGASHNGFDDIPLADAPF